MQVRFSELVDHRKIPQILIHGNPHVANYCKTERGAAMVDFDRSRIGPYAYDIARFLVSISIASETERAFVHPIIIEQFKRGYTTGFTHPKKPFAQMQTLRNTPPKAWQRDIDRYLEAQRKWAGKLCNFETPMTKRIHTLLNGYLTDRGETLLSESKRIRRHAIVPGSMGKLHYLVLLKEKCEGMHKRLIDIKEVYIEEDNEWYHNPFSHHGDRMNAAGEIYAPGWEIAPGKTQHKGNQFWVRQIPLQQVKLNQPLDDLSLSDLAYAVGSQLGRGHFVAAKKNQRQRIWHDFEKRFPLYLEASRTMLEDVKRAHQRYCKKVTLSNKAAPTR